MKFLRRRADSLRAAPTPASSEDRAVSFAIPRFTRILVVFVVTAMIMLAMPVHQVYADTPAPETLAEELTIEAE